LPRKLNERPPGPGDSVTRPFAHVLCPVTMPWLRVSMPCRSDCAVRSPEQLNVALEYSMLPVDDPAVMLTLTWNASGGFSCLAVPCHDPVKAAGIAGGMAGVAALTVEETGLVELWAMSACEPLPGPRALCMTCTITKATAAITTMAAAMVSAPDLRPDEGWRRPAECSCAEWAEWAEWAE